MDEKERQEFDLEDILKEFGDEPAQQPAEEEQAEELPQDTKRMEFVQTEEMEETKRMESVQTEEMDDTKRMDSVYTETPDFDMMDQTRRIDLQELQEDTSGDTIRMEGLREEIAKLEIEPEQDEPFSEQWEPEYEQPMGEYIPPQPIAFRPRNRLQELKQKLIAGPEKRFYELAEMGVGKLQVAIFLSALVVLIAAISTVMYAFGAVQEDRLRLMVFGQFLAMLITALLGSFQLIEGFADMGKKKFTLNSLLAITFLVCCVDGVFCLKQVRVPCCAAFSLEMLMSLWSAYHRRSTEMSQMNTMRKAIRLDGLVPYDNYLNGARGLLRKDGQVEDFMDHYAGIGKPEVRLNRYSLIAMFVAVAIGVVAFVLQIGNGIATAVSAGVQVMAVSLLAAVPATAFISQSRPAALLERRLSKLGTVICGWRGVEGMCGDVIFPLTFHDLYPVEAVRLNGMKFYGSRDPEQVLAYATSLVDASGSGLNILFNHILDMQGGRSYTAYDLEYFMDGGVRGTVNGDDVMVGSYTFLKNMGIEVPHAAKLSYAVYVAVSGELAALFAISYEKTRSAMAGVTTLGAYRKLYSTLISDDFMLTHDFLQSKLGVKPKRFLLAEHDIRVQLRQTEPEADAPVLMMTTSLGLAPLAYGVTGARMLRTACRLGTVLHMVGGIVGLAIMALLVALGALDLLTPANMFLYQLVWMIPAILITEWSRLI